jgi:hypothetical protein
MKSYSTSNQDDRFWAKDDVDYVSPLPNELRRCSALATYPPQPPLQRAPLAQQESISDSIYNEIVSLLNENLCLSSIVNLCLSETSSPMPDTM